MKNVIIARNDVMKVFPAAIAMIIVTLFGSPTNGQTVSSQGKGFVTAEQNSPIVGDDGYLQGALGNRIERWYF